MQLEEHAVYSDSYSTVPCCRTIYGNPRSFGDIKDTIKGFNMIMDGELDHLPEAALNLKGTIEGFEAGEKMLPKQMNHNLCV